VSSIFILSVSDEGAGISDSEKKEIFKKIIRTDLSKSLPSIKLPTIVVWGETDTYVPLRYGKEIARLIPNSKIYVIPRVGHGVHLREPDTLLKFIIEHVKTI
jgi:pimeloyl-ACP methyl ester carboxylesterase